MVKDQKEKTEKSKRARKIWKWVIWITMGLVLVGAIVSVLVWWNLEGSKTDLEKRGLPDRGVPVMEIKLDGVSLEEIDGGPKSTKYEGNEVILYEGSEAFSYDNVEIKGRGNTTWNQEKKPYQIKFAKNVDLLGLGKAKKWVLLANALDKSFLRNDAALLLAEMLEMPYNNRGDFVELYINDDYRGLYYLVQKIEIAKGSVDLRGGNGILFELDSLHRNEDEPCYETYLGECLILKDLVVDKEENKEEIADGFLTDLNDAEKAIKEGDYERGVELLDVISFAKYYLVSEFTVNPDAYSTSFYLYRNDDGKIAAGPVWDLDLSMANREWVWQVDDRLFSPYEDMIKRREAFGEDGLDEDLSISKLIYYLVDLIEFRREVEQIYQEKMAGRGEEFIRRINEKAKEIDRAARADEEKWGRMDYEHELIEMKNWIRKRYEHFEQVYGEDGGVSSGVI